MHFRAIVSLTFIAVCSAHVHHKHESPIGEEHYVNGEHNADYDREVLFGGEKEAGEFAKLSPEEQQSRLKSLIKKMDLNSDGFLSHGELSTWIQNSFRHYATQDSKDQFPEYDVDGNGMITWEEYNIHAYDHVMDYDENIPLDDEEEESMRQLFWKDKKRFEKANLDGLPGLSPTEFIAFEHPEEVDYMMDYVIQDALDEHDQDKDGFISLEEFLGDYKKDPNVQDDPEWVSVERDRFENDYDKNTDGKLDPQELQAWVVPNNLEVAGEEAEHIIKEIDTNGDGKLTEAEILNSQDLFLNSEATDYGNQIHDKKFYHVEL
ncbi:reticulocalbin-2 [Callorhinchus milii]|uniref:Reticulocalbin 2 n=1 Tax=Callorhinchus milii TaxID=7868 RepID=V9KAH6_CALMI|nr:reticulocalbin-2 [Callorhinchus milii]|eukprot:gi/632938796/ref/XP_007906433.1/ PREDICTED: reticulocalbin-2 [Callorhinchus milii]